MRCFECGEYEAEYILKSDEQFIPVCEKCLNEYHQLFGEIETDSWDIEFHGWTVIFKEINETIKFRREKYARLVKEWSQLKKKINGGE